MSEKLKHCEGCPVCIHTDYGAYVDSLGCLPNFREAMEMYRNTGKVWACHEKPTVPCVGFLILAKEAGYKISVKKGLMTEEGGE